MDDVRWLSQILPIIRIRDYRLWGLGPKRREFIALYEQRVIVGRIRDTIRIPESVYESNGADELIQLGRQNGSVRESALADITSISTYQRNYLSENDRIYIRTNSGRLRTRVNSRDVPNLYRALELLAGQRYSGHRFPSALGIIFRFLPFLIFILLAWIGFLDDAFLYPLIMLIVISGVFALAGTIPAARRPKRRTKKTTADLSGTSPVRAPAIGKGLTLLSALFVVAYLAIQLNDFVAVDDSVATLPPIVTYISAAAALFIFPCFVLAGRPGVGLTILVFLIAAAVAAFQAALAPTKENLEALLVVVAPYCALLLLYLGRSLQARSVEEESQQDKRQPILYLRAFEDDVQNTLSPHSFLARLFGITIPDQVWRMPLWQRVIFEAHPYRLLRTLVGQTSKSTEVQLANFFRSIGPFVAIGEPGERFSPEGASREYVRNEEWQARVMHYMEQSRFTVLHAASSEGFLWEVNTALNRVPPDRILFCLSNFRGRQNEYEDFRLRAEETYGWRFPRSIGNRREPHFLFFDRSRNAIVHQLSYVSPIKWGFLGTVSDIAYTLQSFVEGDADAPYAPQDWRRHNALATLLFLTVVPAVWVLVLHVANSVVDFVRS